MAARRLGGLVLVVCLAIALAVLPVLATPAPLQPLGTRHELANGLVWLFSQQSGLPLVTVNLLIKGGTLRDPRDKAGLANLTALLLSQGTKTRKATQIAQELDFMGARFRAAGQDDFIVMSLTVLKKDLAAGLALFGEMLYHPTFPPEELQRKMTQLLASLQAEEDEPGVVASRAFERTLFGSFPYGHPPKGTREGLKAIKPKDLVDFHRQFYRPNNAILAVAGDLTPEEAAKWVEQTFGGWKPGPIPALRLPPIPSLQETQITVINKNITQANLILGHLGIARRNPDFYAFQVLNYILGGGGFSSRLMDNIRENRGLAYSVGSSFDPGVEPGSFTVILETKNQSAGEAVAQILKELKRIRTEPVTETELKDAKSYLIGSFPRKMDSLDKRAGLLSYVEFYGLGLDYPQKYPELIRDLTPADLRRVAEKYLHPERYLLVVVGKKAEMPPLSGPQPPGTKEKKDESQQPDR